MAKKKVRKIVHSRHSKAHSSTLQGGPLVAYTTETDVSTPDKLFDFIESELNAADTEVDMETLQWCVLHSAAAEEARNSSDPRLEIAMERVRGIEDIREQAVAAKGDVDSAVKLFLRHGPILRRLKRCPAVESTMQLLDKEGHALGLAAIASFPPPGHPIVALLGASLASTYDIGDRAASNALGGGAEVARALDEGAGSFHAADAADVAVAASGDDDDDEESEDSDGEDGPGDAVGAPLAAAAANVGLSHTAVDVSGSSHWGAANRSLLQAAQEHLELGENGATSGGGIGELLSAAAERNASTASRNDSDDWDEEEASAGSGHASAAVEATASAPALPEAIFAAPARVGEGGGGEEAALSSGHANAATEATASAPALPEAIVAAPAREAGGGDEAAVSSGHANGMVEAAAFTPALPEAIVAAPAGVGEAGGGDEAAASSGRANGAVEPATLAPALLASAVAAPARVGEGDNGDGSGGAPVVPRVLSTSSTVPSGFRWLGLRKVIYQDATGEEREWEACFRTTKPSGTGEGSGVDAVYIVATVKAREQPQKRQKRFWGRRDTSAKAADDSLVLVRQFRPPIGALTVELPAGLVDENESCEAATLRELLEETGFVGRVTHVSPATFTEPGMSEASACFVSVAIDGSDSANAAALAAAAANAARRDNNNSAAPVAVAETAVPDEGEHIEVLLVPLRELLAELNRMAAQGNAIDAPLYAYALGREGLKLQMCQPREEGSGSNTLGRAMAALLAAAGLAAAAAVASTTKAQRHGSGAATPGAIIKVQQGRSSDASHFKAALANPWVLAMVVTTAVVLAGVGVATGRRQQQRQR